MKFIIRVAGFFYRKLGKNFRERVKKEQARPFTVLSKAESNEYFKKVIESGTPAMLSRLGTPESNCVLNYLQVVRYSGAGLFKRIEAAVEGNTPDWNEQVKTDLENLVGFFPCTEENLLKFSSVYSEKLKNADGIGIWGFVPGENFILRKYCPVSIKYDPGVLDPYFFSAPWTAQLKGKKILVVHPFADSITLQYEKRALLFKNKEILPDFELHTVKTVQSIAGNKTAFGDWFEALEYMKEKISRVDFEIALIAAGSYGVPLAAYIKSLGKCAIHMGGSLQILFGIKGKRWDDHPPTVELYNEHWIRPGSNETVPNAIIVEGGCYW